jgi:hypothetical protein
MKYDTLVVHGCSFLTIPFENENIIREGVNLDVLRECLPKGYDVNKVIKSELGNVSAEYPWSYNFGELKRHTFSRLLSKKLECREINLSMPGANNQQMIRRLYEWSNKEDVLDVMKPVHDRIDEDDLPNYVPKYKNEDKTLIILGLTDVSRLEFWTSLKEIYFPVTVDLDIWTSHEDRGMRELVDVEEYIKHFEFHYKNLYTDEERILSLQRELEMFQSYCNERNIDIIFFGSLFGDNKDWEINPDSWSRELSFRKKGHTDKLNTDKLNYYIFPNGITDWRNYIYSQDKKYAYGHPMAKDHEDLADLFYDYISENLL